MSESLKLCIDCRHYDPDTSHQRDCRCPALMIDPIDGFKYEVLMATYLRMGPCGYEEPKYWEPNK